MNVERQERAEYLCAMTRELAQMAREEGYKMLAYLLDMAYFEASELSAKWAAMQAGDRGGQSDRLANSIS